MFSLKTKCTCFYSFRKRLIAHLRAFGRASRKTEKVSRHFNSILSNKAAVAFSVVLSTFCCRKVQTSIKQKRYKNILISYPFRASDGSKITQNEVKKKHWVKLNPFNTNLVCTVTGLHYKDKVHGKREEVNINVESLFKYFCS